MAVEVGDVYVEKMDREERKYNNPCRVEVLEIKDDRAYVKCINGGFDRAWWAIDWLENGLQWRKQ